MVGVINKIRFADAYLQIIVLTLLIQLVLVSSTFPIGELLTATPLYHIDAPHHWYQITVAAARAQQGYLIGYDPFFSPAALPLAARSLGLRANVSLLEPEKCTENPVARLSIFTVYIPGCGYMQSMSG